MTSIVILVTQEPSNHPRNQFANMPPAGLSGLHVHDIASGQNASPLCSSLRHAELIGLRAAADPGLRTRDPLKAEEPSHIRCICVARVPKLRVQFDVQEALGARGIIIRPGAVRALCVILQELLALVRHVQAELIERSRAMAIAYHGQ